METVDTIVVGAGVIGLACARAIALKGRRVIIIEAASAIGTSISSRNSEVIHAGIYYPQGSLKARACVQGNRMLQSYAQSRGVPYQMVGKIIVATRAEEAEALGRIEQKSRANGVEDLRWLTHGEVSTLEPELNSHSALISPSTGIIDSHALMLALLGDAEGAGAVLALQCEVTGGEPQNDGIVVRIKGDQDYDIKAGQVVLAGGLSSPDLARKFGLANIPAGHFCKGNYFSLTGKMPFSRLVYPVPAPGGLGIHYTLDLAGRGRFGPDVEWVEKEEYAVNENRRAAFAQAIRGYWPACREENLSPSYSGIRPKIVSPGEPDGDFKILDEADHGVKNIIALLGIESPGLTSCLALAEMVAEKF